VHSFQIKEIQAIVVCYLFIVPKAGAKTLYQCSSIAKKQNAGKS